LMKNSGEIKVWRSCTWVFAPLLEEGFDQLATDVRFTINLSKRHEKFAIQGENNSLPMYQFKLDDLATLTGVQEVAESALDIINVVPNPYYAHSEYEQNKLDNRV